MASRVTKAAAQIALALTIAIFGGQATAAGALAINVDQGSQYGFAHGHPNTEKAEQRALSECGGGCKVVLQYNSGCAAYAADQSKGASANGWGTGSSGSAAQGRAQSECQSRGGSSCIVRSWACD